MPGSGRSSSNPPGARPASARAFVLRFALAFAVLEGFVYFVLWHAPLFEPYAELNVRIVVGLLRPFLDGTEAHGPCLVAPAFSLQVRPGCDSFQASAVLFSGILAFPAPLARKLIGAVIGGGALLVLNLLRLAALLWTGVHHRELFQRMHLEVLPAVFVVAALFLLLAWALWARRTPASVPHATGNAARG